MPVNLKQNDPALWEERVRFITRLKELIPYCEISLSPQNLSVHEYLGQYSKKYRPEVNRLFTLHPGNCIVLNNSLHINKKPSIEACMVAVIRRRIEPCRQFGFPNGRAMVADFCKKVVELYNRKKLNTLPPFVQSFSEIKI